MAITKRSILNNINSIICVLLLLICFLPMFVMNTQEFGYINRLSISGFESFTGMEFSDGSVMDSNFISIFLFLSPIALILTSNIQKLEKWKKYCIFGTPIASIIFLIITKFSVQSNLNVSLSLGAGFWLYLILSLILLGISYLQYKSISLDKDQIKNIIEKSSNSFVDASQNILGVTCPKCGNKILNNEKFCPKCGTESPNNKTEN